MNRKTARAARARFVGALYKRYAVTGLRQGYDIALTISKRTGVPVAAIVVTPGQDSLTYGAARIVAHKAWKLCADEDLSLVFNSSLEVD